jgi:5-(carboxyamino)imidazole ribonucleotide synthase
MTTAHATSAALPPTGPAARPGPVVGMVGAGQLARMTYAAAIPLGVTLRVLAESERDSAALVARETDLGSPRSLEAMRAFAGRCDVVTFDHELIDLGQLAELERAGHVLRPAVAVKALAHDKGLQRERLGEAGLPLPAWRRVGSADDIAGFAEEHGWPVVAKSTRGGYDGRGVWVLEDAAMARSLHAEASGAGLELLVEVHVEIARELAVLVARRPAGEVAVYPPVETVQRAGINREVLAPAPVAAETAERSRALAGRLAVDIASTGILAIELFETAGGELLVNELAARPHNSGHFSIEGARTSQFENHLRAALDWPLGSTELTAPAVAMVNVLGPADGSDPAERMARALEHEEASIHLYGKAARPGRKLGHVTATGASLEEARDRAHAVAGALTAEDTRG